VSFRSYLPNTNSLGRVSLGEIDTLVSERLGSTQGSVNRSRRASIAKSQCIWRATSGGGARPQSAGFTKAGTIPLWCTPSNGSNACALRTLTWRLCFPNSKEVSRVRKSRELWEPFRDRSVRIRLRCEPTSDLNQEQWTLGQRNNSSRMAANGSSVQRARTWEFGALARKF